MDQVQQPFKIWRWAFSSIYSRAPPKSSTPDSVKQQMSNQSETGRWYISGLIEGAPTVIYWMSICVVSVCSIICMLFCVHLQGRGTGNTAALRSTSTIVVSPGLTLTRDASLSCLSSSALETVFLSSKRWDGLLQLLACMNSVLKVIWAEF